MLDAKNIFFQIRDVKWPLQREAHARNDKVHKTDYREELALEGDNYDRGGNEPTAEKPLFSFKGNYLYINTKRLETDAQKFLEHTLRRNSIFRIKGYLARPGWSKKNFCKHNNLQNIGDAVFEEISAELEELFKITIKNLRRAEREIGPTEVVRNGLKKKCYKFKSGFVPVNVGNLETKKLVLDIDFFNAK